MTELALAPAAAPSPISFDYIGVPDRWSVPAGFEIFKVLSDRPRPVAWGEKHPRIRVIARRERTKEET